MSHLIIKRLTTKQRQTWEAVLRKKEMPFFHAYHISRELRVMNNTARERLNKLVRLKLLVVNRDGFENKYSIKES